MTIVADLTRTSIVFSGCAQRSSRSPTVANFLWRCASQVSASAADDLPVASAPAVGRHCSFDAPCAATLYLINHFLRSVYRSVSFVRTIRSLQRGPAELNHSRGMNRGVSCRVFSTNFEGRRLGARIERTPVGRS